MTFLKINKREEWWVEADRCDKRFAYTYNQLNYALTDAGKDLERIDTRGPFTL